MDWISEIPDGEVNERVPGIVVEAVTLMRGLKYRIAQDPETKTIKQPPVKQLLHISGFRYASDETGVTFVADPINPGDNPIHRQKQALEFLSHIAKRIDRDLVMPTLQVSTDGETFEAKFPNDASFLNFLHACNRAIHPPAHDSHVHAHLQQRSTEISR